MIGLVFCVSPGGAMALTVMNPPASLLPGQNVTINVAFTRSAGDVEKRLIFFLEMHRLTDHALLGKSVLDNSGTGYAAQSGTLTFSMTAPQGESGSVYFKAWAVPWSLNRAMVARYKSYPTNGTFTYLWSGGGYGVTQNVYYRGSLICPKPAQNTTYCSGLAFETFLLGYSDYNSVHGHATIGGLTASQMEAFRRVWYGVTDAEKLAARALPEYGLGVEITDFEEAQEGDSIQFWRWSGSGHNPVFVHWVRNGSGQITGFRYWGSQGSSNGIGYNTESFGTTSGVNRSRFYIGRVRKPRDQDDYNWALGTSSTESQPTYVGVSSINNWADYDADR